MKGHTCMCNGCVWSEPTVGGYGDTVVCIGVIEVEFTGKGLVIAEVHVGSLCCGSDVNEAIE